MIYPLLPTRVRRAYYGGKNIDLLTGAASPAVTRYPEDWLGSVTTALNPDRPVENEGLSRTQDGRFLKDLIDENRKEMIGDRDAMTLLFKLLDAAERLVIQVHPTVAFAKEAFHSPFGKTECWYILGNGGYVYLGFKPGVTREKWQNLFEKQDIAGMLDSLHRFDVKKGDFVFVAGGVPHAIGAGCFLAELQEPTDLMVITERVTPSGVVLAEQKLHGNLGFEKMFDCFSYETLDRKKTREKYFISPRRISENEKAIADERVTDKFRLSELTVDGALKFPMDSYGILLAFEGSGTVNGVNVKQGDRLFIPEAEKRLAFSGKLTCLLCRP